MAETNGTEDLPPKAITDLDDLGRKILVLLIEDPLLFLREIGGRLGVSASTVLRRTRSKEFKSIYQEMVGNTDELIASLQEKTLHRMHQIVAKSKNEGSAIRVAEIVHIGIPGVKQRMGLDALPSAPQLPNMDQAKQIVATDPCDVVDAEFEEE